MGSFLPRIEISLSKIRHNAQVLSELYGEKGISIMGVSKAVLGDPAIALAMTQGGVDFIADSRIENIQKMKDAEVIAQFVLLRTALSQAEDVVINADISLNTEIETITKLSHYSKVHHKIHKIIIMVELGDLREGVLPSDLSDFVRETLLLKHIKIAGIGCNLACYGGIIPDSQKMYELSRLANEIEKDFQIKLEIISGGNSANYEWYKLSQNTGRINNLRLGESILLGRETVHRKAIPKMYTNAFKLIAEVIESKEKPSIPNGTVGQNSFGVVPTFHDRGDCQRVIVALGRQDALISGLTSDSGFEILGSSSDHTILDCKNFGFKIGAEVSFSLDYGGLLSAMTSPFIRKQFV
jgi:ornithine racemase